MDKLNNINNTLRLKANEHNSILTAANILKKGGVVALPTETVYGLAANGFCEAAIARIFKAKKRPNNNPLILHVKNKEQALSLLDIDCKLTLDRFKKLSQKFWPGPLTIIAKAQQKIPKIATGGLDTAAVRIPDCKESLRVLNELDFPLVMPSANVSTRPSPTSMKHVLLTMDHRIDAVLDGGHCRIGVESSVIRIDCKNITLLRPGSIGKDELEKCLNEEVIQAKNNETQLPISPGCSYLHYSPKVKSARMINVDEAKKYWFEKHSIIITNSEFDKLKEQFGNRDNSALTIVLSDDPINFGQHLYGALYKSEEKINNDLLIILPRIMDSRWNAIIDRLNRACSHNF